MNKMLHVELCGPRIRSSVRHGLSIAHGGIAQRFGR
jgi:hypothetical protein